MRVCPWSMVRGPSWSMVLWFQCCQIQTKSGTLFSKLDGSLVAMLPDANCNLRWNAGFQIPECFIFRIYWHLLIRNGSMKLLLWVVSAQYVENKHWRNSSGFYVVAKLGCSKRKTRKVQAKGVAPIWNEALEFVVRNEENIFKRRPITVILKQGRRFSKNIVIGWNEITSKTAVPGADTVKYQMKLLDRLNQPSHIILNLRLRVTSASGIGMSAMLGYESRGIRGNGKDAELRGCFAINVYCAEGLPKMDSGIFQDLQTICSNPRMKKCVDPYFTITYQKKSVQTSVMHGTDCPEWLQRLQLEFDGPLAGDRIRLQLTDRDYSSRDDRIATAYLEMAHISSDGFLPCFGPAYVNFYGSLREYRLLEISSAKEMNEAEVEGCAFRGRVLMSLETKMLRGNLDPLRALGSNTLVSLQPYIRKRGYVLRTTFLNATLMSIVDGEVSFEVSVGTFGYSSCDFEEASSRTWPEVPRQLTGSPSCFMPWTEEKPTVVFVCEWEDVSYRIETAIAISRALRTIKKCLVDLERGKGEKIVITEFQAVAVKFVNLFRSLSEELRESPKTTLDVHLTARRLDVFESIVERTSILMTDSNWKLRFEDFTNSLEGVLIDLQIGIPDIFIWMLVDQRREAYCRVSPIDVWYSGQPDRLGHLCKKPSNFFCREPLLENRSEENRVMAVVNAEIWFGFSEHATECMTSEDNATFAAHIDIVASRRAKCMGRWNSIPYTVSPPRNKIKIPVAWAYDNDWHLKTTARKVLWRRRLTAIDETAPSWMTLLLHTQGLASPGIKPTFSLIFHESHVYRCNVYIHQARCLLANDMTGLSDPGVNVVLMSHHGWTEHVKETLCPMWNRTVNLSGIVLYGKPHLSLSRPPEIWIEVFDHAEDGTRTELIGEATVIPCIHLASSVFSPTELDWHPIMYNGQHAGEVLASSDLVLVDDSSEHHVNAGVSYEPIPAEISPELENCVLEMFCWGIHASRNTNDTILEVLCEDRLLFSLNVSPFPVENLQKKHFLIDMSLAKQEKYLPPLILKLKEAAKYGQWRTLGVHIIKSISQFKAVENFLVASDVAPNGYTESVSAGNENVDWWVKYNASKKNGSCKIPVPKRNFETLRIYDCELENVPCLQHMLDFPRTFPLVAGRVTRLGKSQIIIGDVLAMFCLHKQMRSQQVESFARFQQFERKPEGPVLVRVYIVRAVDLAPRDLRRSADPYVVLKAGDRKISLREHCRNNTLNPIFGLFTEFHASLPQDRNLVIRVMDRDVVSGDDLIGETIVNLEQRFSSPFRAACGVPPTYNGDGPFQWRDSKTPQEILGEVCQFQGLPQPRYLERGELLVGTKTFEMAAGDENKSTGEWLAVRALHAVGVVPEHVETRRLFLRDKPGQVQGLLEMWVDLFPCGEQPGPPVDISIPQPEKFQLRCVIYNALVEEKGTFGGTMCDMYIKGWMKGIDDVQETDVHFRCMDGKGNFNWRFVIPFEYIVSQSVVVSKKRLHFWDLSDTQILCPPILNLNVMDYDRFSMDDAIGVMRLNLQDMPCPTRTNKFADIHRERVNLFQKRRVTGFWPYRKPDDSSLYMGSVEMELELLTAEEAERKPAGFGRNPPNENPALTPPKRPSTAFSWLKAPWRVARHMLCFKFRRYTLGIGLVLVAIIVLFIILKTFLEETSHSFAEQVIG